MTALDLASRMRANIFRETGCKASAGIASNILLARMATRKAKPDGQFHLQSNDVKEFMGMFLGEGYNSHDVGPIASS